MLHCRPLRSSTRAIGTQIRLAELQKHAVCLANLGRRLADTCQHLGPKHTQSDTTLPTLVSRPWAGYSSTLVSSTNLV